MNKIIYILLIIFTTSSCGPRRLRCGPNRRCDIQTQKLLNDEKNSTTSTYASLIEH